VDDASRLAAEQRARVLIDAQLTAAGWSVQGKGELNLHRDGVAVREVVMGPGHGRVDYLLYVQQKVVGVIEAKPEGTTLSGVEWQSAMYATGLPESHTKRAVTVGGRLPFAFETSGTETHFTNGYDPDPRARRVFAFPTPATLARIVRDAEADPDRPTWRAKVHHLPALDETPLRRPQVAAIRGLEQSLVEQRFSRSLVQMATGAGKTYTAVTECYRLLKWGGFSRVLFLVDRNNLGDQAKAEFENFRTPDDRRRFTELYPVAKLSSAGMLASSSVVISTIQRVYQVLSGATVTDTDDPGIDDFTPDAPVGVQYSAEITNWTGHVIAARRSDLADLLRRTELARTGVYILLGDDAEAVGETRCYVGEADVVGERLRSHEKQKVFWDRVVVITSKDANLTKAHGRYLEARLLALAAQAARVTLENGTAPVAPPLPEADVSDMNYFVGQLQIVLPCSASTPSGCARPRRAPRPQRARCRPSSG